jgi:signal transduction histidine kinase
MRWSVRRKTVAFIVLGCLGVGGAVALNIGWVIVSWREAGLLVAGLVLFPLIITGVVLNTIFLVREIRRNEQHENFINAVTHELKTPIASVKLHLQTLQQRQVDESKRQEFYQVMVEDCDRRRRRAPSTWWISRSCSTSASRSRRPGTGSRLASSPTPPRSPTATRHASWATRTT